MNTDAHNAGMAVTVWRLFLCLTYIDENAFDIDMIFLNLLKFYCLKNAITGNCIASFVYNMLLNFKIKEKNYYKISVQNTKWTHGKNSWRTGKCQNANHRTKSRRNFFYEMFQSWMQSACALIHKHLDLYNIVRTRNILWY